MTSSFFTGLVIGIMVGGFAGAFFIACFAVSKRRSE